MLAFLVTNWRAIAIAIVAAVLFSAGWKVRDWQADADAVAAQEAYRVALEASLAERKEVEDRMALESKNLEKRLAELRRKNREAEHERIKEFEKADYSCTVPADGVRIISGAIAEANASRAAR